MLLKRLSSSRINTCLGVFFPLIALLLGVIGLLGWHLSIPALLYWDNTTLPFGYYSAGLLLFSSLSILLLRTRMRKLQILFIAAIILIVGVDNIAGELSVGPQLESAALATFIGIDDSFAHFLPRSAAIGFLLIAAALTLLQSRALRANDLVIAGGISFLVLAVACVGLLGNVTRAAQGTSLGFGELVDMSFPTALGQILIGLSLLGYSWLGQGKRVLSNKKPLRLMVVYAICGVFVIAVFSAALGMSPLYQFMERVDHERMLEFVTQKARHGEELFSRLRKVGMDFQTDLRFRGPLESLRSKQSDEIQFRTQVIDVFRDVRKNEPALTGFCLVLSSVECAVSDGEIFTDGTWPTHATERKDAALGEPFVRQGRLFVSSSIPIWAPDMTRVGTQLFLFSLGELASSFSTGPVGRSAWDVFLLRSDGSESVRLISFSKSRSTWTEQTRAGGALLPFIDAILQQQSNVREGIFNGREQQVGAAAPVPGTVLGVLGLFDPSEFRSEINGVLRRVATGVLSLVGTGCLVLFLLLREMTLRTEELGSILKERTERLRRELEARRQTEEQLQAYREQLEERVLQRGEELQHSLKRLRETERLASLGAMASGIAQELNNPLNAMILAAQNGLDQSRQVKDRAKALHIYEETCRRIIQQGRRCSGVVKSVIQFSSPERAAKAPSDLNEVAKNVVRLIRETYDTQHVDISLELTSTVPTVLLNTLEVEQALFVLLRAALERSASAIRIRTAEDGARVLLQVRDNGKSIPGEQRRQLLAAGRDHDVPGLASASRLLSAQGGLVEARFHERQGATVLISFPRFQADVSDGEAAEINAQGAPGTSSRAAV